MGAVMGGAAGGAGFVLLVGCAWYTRKRVSKRRRGLRGSKHPRATGPSVLSKLFATGRSQGKAESIEDTLPPGIAVAASAQGAASVVEKVSMGAERSMERFVDLRTGHAREAGARNSRTSNNELEC